MKKCTVRTIPIMFLLNIVTCGWYYIYWIYQTSSEIKRFTEREDLNPTLEVILGIVTGGLYFKYWYYKYGKIVYKEMPLKVGMNNTEDKTMTLVLIDITVAVIYFFNIYRYRCFSAVFLLKSICIFASSKLVLKKSRA